MQGRPGQGKEPWDKERSTAAHLAALNGTSSHRAIPQRPPGMTRLHTPPETPRVPRPQRQAPPPKKVRKGVIILGTVFAVVAIIVLAIVVVLNYAIGQTDPSTNTAVDFLSSLSSSNDQQAFKDLGPGVTIRINQQQFIQQAQSIDHIYGTITDYTEVPNSAVVQNNGTIRSYTYTITRSKLKKPYQMRLTLQQDAEDSNTWRIIDYGTSLGPTQ